MTYKVHTPETAPEGAKETLTGAQSAFGFVPNLLGVMAEAPALVKAYWLMARLFDETSFSPTERQTVLLAASLENDCTYCVAAHSVIAGRQQVPAEIIDAIRNGNPIPDERLEALRRFTANLVANRGWPDEQASARLLAAGYSPAQMLEVVLGVGFKTLSNYTNHIAHTPLDDAFAKAAWSKAS